MSSKLRTTARQASSTRSGVRMKTKSSPPTWPTKARGPPMARTVLTMMRAVIMSTSSPREKPYLSLKDLK